MAGYPCSLHAPVLLFTGIFVIACSCLFEMILRFNTSFMIAYSNGMSKPISTAAINTFGFEVDKWHSFLPVDTTALYLQ
jgi:hypothetical protein